MNLSFFKTAIAGLSASLAFASFDAAAYGQTVYPAYRIHYETVNVEQTVYRPSYETIYEEQTITSQRPVYETETRVRRYTVAKPVNETSTQIKRYTVRKQVLDTETRTQERVVRRPVTEQVMQTRSHVVYDPVTTMQTQYVDQGSYVDNYVLKPGVSRNRLQWLQGGYVQDPLTGSMVYQRAGFHWVPTAPPATYQVERQYVPNVVAQEVAQTTYQQRVVNEQIPVNVTRYEDVVVQEPVQVQVCKFVDEVVEQPVQVTTQRIEYETKEEPVEVRVQKWVTDSKTVQVPRTVMKWVQETQVVPRTVARRVPINTCSPCTIYNPSTVTYYAPASALPSVVTTPAAPTTVQRVETKAPEVPAAAAPKAEGEAKAVEEAEAAPNDATPTGEPELKPGTARVVPIPDVGRSRRDSEAGNDYIADNDGNSTA
ncbi:MAG: hypothetical protein H6821_00130 [Planctomycetaceae bacterium]|nr:hypothetical protein [Planctomycetales bacterium]MCB9872558.1 hypothetical protein [Planctomycetaceae bacterium]MCB9939616.1 hypothetical protein [Planctomycetaceae bacterium]HRX77497.1 hypothetical protein [Pirellulaceae bacterium]